MSTGPLLVVDGGGSRFRGALLHPEGNLLWRGEAPGGAVTRCGAEQAAASIAAFWRQASGRIRSPISTLLAGLAGARRPEVQQQVAGELRRLLGRDLPDELPLHITHDGSLALAGAFGCFESGCVMISGTGAMAIARNRQGQVVLAGGWGWPLGDEGSAAWIGLQGVRLAAAACEQKQEGALRALVAAGWELDLGGEQGLGRLLSAAVEAADDPARYGLLAPAVLAAAADGQPQARGIVEEAGRWLGRRGAEALERLGEDVPESVPVALTGGVGSAWPHLLTRGLHEGAGRWGARFHLRTPLLEPLGGAVLLARRAMGGPWDQRIEQELIRSLQRTLAPAPAKTSLSAVTPIRSKLPGAGGGRLIS